MRLGKSQKVVLDYIRDHPGATSQETGDALYAKTSSCAQYGDGTGSMGGKSTPEEIRRMWASKLLSELLKRGCVGFTKEGNEKHWFERGGE